jgi:hypothetical protein
MLVKTRLRLAAGLCAVLLCSAMTSMATAAILYSEKFDSDVSANWTTATGPGTHAATFGYDYSVLGIPAAPGNAANDTKGLRLQGNMSSVASGTTGFSTSPNGQSFSGDYVITFSAWQNYGGSGTTMMNTYSLGTNGTTGQYPGSVTGIMFASTSDGGSASDYRAYGPGNGGVQITTAGTYAAGSQNNSNVYYNTPFPGGATSPAVQGPTLISPAGTPAFTWVQTEITKIGNIVTWKANGSLIATVDLSAQAALGGTNIALGHSDINATGPSDPNLVFGLIDNLTVTSIVPEPTSLSLLGLAGVAALFRRK